jgi:hypothetical protein
MQETLQLLLVVAVITIIAFLITQSTSDAVQQRIRLEEQIQELLVQDEVTLADFIDVLGQPKSIETVTCEGTKCIKAVWDLSYATVECWKRLVVVLNEEKRRVFFSEFIDLVVVQRSLEGVRCVEAPR